MAGGVFRFDIGARFGRVSTVILTLPIALTWNGDHPIVTFGTVDSADLKLPFWSDTLARCQSVTGLQPLDAFALDDSALTLSGSILHLTRCGSTLVARQLGAVTRTAVLSEPFIFQHLIEGPLADSAITRRRMRQLFAAFRDGLAPVADRIVVKWPPLFGHYAAQLQEALPAPTLFLHRDPVEVLASILRHPAGTIDHLKPHHLAPLGEAPPPMPERPLQRAATMLAAICTSVSRQPGIRSLDYARLPEATQAAIAPFFGMALTEADRESLRQASQFYSKKSGENYAADREADLPLTSPRVIEAARDILGPAYAAMLAGLSPL